MSKDMDRDKSDFRSVVPFANPKNSQRRHLIAYSKADLGKFPTCDLFGNMIEKHFNAGTEIKTKVEYWICSREDHQERNKHYHVSLKLSHLKKWISVKNSI